MNEPGLTLGSRAEVSSANKALAEGIVKALGGRTMTELVSVNEFDRVVAASDASHYLLTPTVVVRPQ